MASSSCFSQVIGILRGGGGGGTERNRIVPFRSVPQHTNEYHQFTFLCCKKQCFFFFFFFFFFFGGGGGGGRGLGG